jgi:hypothetical protein
MEANSLDVKVSKIDWNEDNAANIGMYLYSFLGFISKYIRKLPHKFVGFDRQYFLHKWPDFDQASYGGPILYFDDHFD